MKIALKDLAYIDEFDLLKIILSSADIFPGLYRFSSSWKVQLESENFMKTLSFLETCHYAEQGKVWNRSDWLKVHERVYSLAFGEGSRDSERANREVGALLQKKSLNWLNSASSLSLAIIETNFLVEEILPGTTYYLMGSLIRFENDCVKISYNHYTKDCYAILNIPFSKVNQYINNTFSQKSLSELFFKAEIVGELDFKNNEGKLSFSHEINDELLVHFSGNSPVFGAVNYEEILPIRFAKIIGISNVTI